MLGHTQQAAYWPTILSGMNIVDAPNTPLVQSGCVGYSGGKFRNLLEMLRVYARPFIEAVILTTRLRDATMQVPDDLRIDPDVLPYLVENAAELVKALQAMDLPVSQAAARRIGSLLESDSRIARMKFEIEHLHQSMMSEMDSVVMFTMASSRVDMYDSAYPFGQEVASKIPSAITDCEEAAKCLALERPTACVFHLMRVMERGLHRFAKKLRADFSTDWQWQTILNHINQKIAALPDKTSKDKQIKAKYCEIASHLYHVKLAWRNTVMHPKASYSMEEAAEVFERVKVFTAHLAKAV